MPRTADMRLRAATARDGAFIVEMARHACVIEDGPLPDADSEETPDRRSGAVWTFHHEPPLLVPADAVSLPELTIAVAPGMRGNGVGGALLDELIGRCTGRYRAIMLNVHQRNPAARLHERKGFRMVGRGRGALGIAMRIDLW